MLSGEVELVGANQVLATISPPSDDFVATAVLRIITSAGFDGTLSLKRRPRRSAGKALLVAILAAYTKLVDGTVGSAAIVPGAAVTQDYSVDISGHDLLPEITGRTAGTISLYWTVVIG